MRVGWVDRLNYLLCERHITNEDAGRFQELKGVLLQSKQNDDGLRSAAIRGLPGSKQ